MVEQVRTGAAGDEALFQEALRALEWDRVLALLAGQAHSSPGAERCRALALETAIGAANARIRQTAEMSALDEGTDPFPPLAFPDLGGALDRAAKGAILETREIRDFAIAIRLAAETSRYLDRRREQAPALAAIASGLVELRALDPVEASIDRCIDPDGNVRESATPLLERLARHAASLKQRMRDRMAGILSSSRYAEALQERYFAERENRYVIPVKAEMRSRIPGIVHDVSASGATVFIEPRELVDLNNSIKVADLEIAREIQRILRELSALIASHAPAFAAGMDALAELDCVAAKAGVARLVQGRAVLLNDAGRVVLKQARHPLLVLARESVVANDIVMDESVRVLVLSGPNTGGKTVTLKIVGLFALMARAGLLLPCAADSEMAFFPAVYADIGDAQDLTKDLSSFSAHMTKMVKILSQAPPVGAIGGGEGGDRDAGGRPGALVLLDEAVTSTDPAEGAALAEALLARLARLGMKVVVTTHYGSLKALAQTTAGFRNASVGFDVATLSPTYRLTMGVPGGSAAIEIAGRLGMDKAILDEALGLIGREDRLLDRTMQGLREQQRRLDEEAERAAVLRAEAERLRREAAETAERLKLSESEARKKTKTKLEEELSRARAEVQAALDGLKSERTAGRAKEARRKLAEIANEARAGAGEPEARGEPIDRSARAGDRVRVVSLGAIGILLEAPEGKKRVRVKVGGAEMSVSVSGLRAISEAAGIDEPEAGGSGASRRSKPAGIPGDLASPDVLDVRGKTADEALELTISALDHAVFTGATSIRVIHGHGTGRLKAALRDYLKGSPYVASYRPGDRFEGGDGVTIVDLK